MKLNNITEHILVTIIFFVIIILFAKATDFESAVILGLALATSSAVMATKKNIK